MTIVMWAVEHQRHAGQSIWCYTPKLGILLKLERIRKSYPAADMHRVSYQLGSELSGYKKFHRNTARAIVFP